MPYEDEHSCRVRDPVEHWSEDEARDHCKSHGGIKFEPATGGDEEDAEGDVTINISVSPHADCASQHFGPWCIEPNWMGRALAAIRSGTLRPSTEAAERAASGGGYVEEGGIAFIRIYGEMTKRGSSFGGCSTIRVRRAIREATNDASVKGMLLRIDSPGGTVAGTAALADDVAEAASRKPTHAYIEDLGASAAYWVASQADHLAAGRTAEVGSIGTYSVVEDYSEAAEQQGITVHVISTGFHKGAFVPGNEIEQEHLDYVQGVVDELNGHFLAAVRAGRGMGEEDLLEVADGRVFIAEKARDLGLIDDVGSLDQAIEYLQDKIKSRRYGAAADSTTRKETPMGIFGSKKDDEPTKDEGQQAPDREHLSEMLEAFPEEEHKFATQAYLAGLSIAEAKAKFFDEKLPGLEKAYEERIEELQGRVEKAEAKATRAAEALEDLKGHMRSGPEPEDAPVEQAPVDDVIGMAEKLAEEKDIAFSAAMKEIAREHPEEYERYRAARRGEATE